MLSGLYDLVSNYKHVVLSLLSMACRNLGFTNFPIGILALQRHSSGCKTPSTFHEIFRFLSLYFMHD